MAALPLQSQISQSSNFTKMYKSRVMRLGDGYSNRVQDGLNSIYYTGTIVFNNLGSTDYSTLMTFIDGIGTWGTFDYQPPGAAASCKFAVDQNAVKITPGAGSLVSVQIGVRQEFDL